MPHDAPPSRHPRADELLTQQGAAESRTAAQRLIRSGKVETTDGQKITKPSQKLAPETALRVTAPLRFVSQGGEKLEAWFIRHPADLTGVRALDIGASTGGFTDCLLQRGAQSVTGIDVGHGQLHPRLANDPRVTCLEGINVKALDEAPLPHANYPVVVADLSFISLTKVLTTIWNRVAPGGRAILLVKPQFEAPKTVVDRGRGVVRDQAERQAALERVIACTATACPGAEIIGSLECPVAGGDGNREFLLGLIKGSCRE